MEAAEDYFAPRRRPIGDFESTAREGEVYRILTNSGMGPWRAAEEQILVPVFKSPPSGSWRRSWSARGVGGRACRNWRGDLWDRRVDQQRVTGSMGLLGASWSRIGALVISRTQRGRSGCTERLIARITEKLHTKYSESMRIPRDSAL